MKKRKSTLFTPIVFLSLVLIALISLILSLPRRIPSGVEEASPSNPPSKFSFSNLLKPKTSNLTTFIAVGDIMLGRYCNVQILKNNDWKYPFLKTADLTSSADITFGNLESPLVENCPTTATGMTFCARPEAIEGLKFAGFDILSIANNHILNYGQDGLEQTKKFLSSSNLLYSPLISSNSPNNKITIYQFNNLSFGFLSFDLVTYPHLSLISPISLISPTVDILVVSLHWGAEYQKQPTEEQKKLAHQIIDAGAKIILGHHPHVTQPSEKYNGGLIFYSLGNFIFDQPWSEETKKGNLAKIIFEEKNIKSSELIPIYIQDFCQPQLIK